MTSNHHHVVMFSFGLASFCAARRLTLLRGVENTMLLFTDTRYEDPDTYAWGRAAAKVIGSPLVEIADGRDPWQTFRDQRMIGNNRVATCSRVLKRELARKWMEKHHPDATAATIYVGIHYDERHRIDAIRANWHPYRVEAPLCDRPILSLVDLKTMAREAGLWEQALYAEGFPHANCGGRCVRQGQGGWLRLLQNRPESYAECESQEESMREFLGKDVAILRDRRGGKTVPLTLRSLRERFQRGGQCDLFDVGGCGCFTDSEE